MARSAGTRRQPPISEQLAKARLGPAEAHDVIRQRLGGMAGQWGLRPTDTLHLARQMRTHGYAPGEIILPRGVRADCLGLVVRGQVAVHVGRRGATRLVVILLPGSTFGEKMLAQGRPSNATLQALTDCEIRFLHRADLLVLSADRRTERQAAMLGQVAKGSALLLAALLVLLLVLSLQPSRQALAVVPMSLGQWCRDHQHNSCAWQAWRVAANLVPADPNPLLALGTLHFEGGEVAVAEQYFEAARSMAPGLPEAHNNLGLIYARQGEHERAIAAFQRALALEPGIATTEHNLGLSLQAIQAYDEAVEHYQAALALGEPQANTLLNMAIAYYEAGEPERAEDAARRALGLDPHLAPAYTVLGAVALESRQPEKALPHLQRAIALDAAYGQAGYYLGLAYKSLHQTAEAIAAFEQALVSADDEVMRVRIRRHLGELYEVQESSRAH